MESSPELGGRLFPHKVPLPPEYHLELDSSPLLNEKQIRLYQMLIGTIQWACVVGCLDVCFAVSSLSRFIANPRENYSKLALHVMGYLKKHPNHRIMINSSPLNVDPRLKQNCVHPNFYDDYPDTEEDIPDGLLLMQKNWKHQYSLA